MNKVERAHQMYRECRYTEALALYTESLSIPKTIPQIIALHSNRAACFLKLRLFKQAAEECTSVLALDHKHTGALMLRAQTLVTLKEYQSALFDVNRLLELNPSSEVYLNLQARLKTQLSLAPIPEVESELEEEDEDTSEEDEDINDFLSITCNEQEKKSKEITFEKSDPNIRSPNEFSAPETETKSNQKSSDSPSEGWKTIPKPKGHSKLDYSRWNSVDDSSSGEDDEEDDDETLPKYRFRLKTVDFRPVK